jgi:hypothetical protein
MAATDARGDAVVRVSLDWRDGRHWDGRRERACRVCGTPTNLREASGTPACKTCVEGEIEAEVLAFARTLIARTLIAGTQVTRMRRPLAELAAGPASHDQHNDEHNDEYRDGVRREVRGA